MSLEPEWLVALTAVAFLAGCLDTLAGGGGLLTIPVLMFAGLHPAQALATNKCQAFAGTLTATLKLTHHGQIQWRWIWPYALVAFLCSIVGALALRLSEPDWLAQWVPLLLIGAALYFGLVRMPTDREIPRKPIFWVAGLSAAGIGFYDGFFGPGTGSLFALALVAGLGFGLRQGTAHAKVLNAMTNLAAFIIFATSDLVVWLAAVCMIPAQMVGALVGTRLILGRGIVLVRPFVVILCVIMAIKLASDLWFQGQ
ncbi:MAG: hypothetical protein EBS77_00570 [Gammaproteobacteria bacterium]|nr:hypothetical protein [Gammaproteobacteria bacterium]